MTKGKPWTPEEEKQLKQMLQANKSVRTIAKTLGKTRECIRMKIARLGLEVVVASEHQPITTTQLVLPTELPSVEETLKKLAAALTALETPGLEQSEVLRLRGMIQGCKVYKDILAEYADYRGLEAELLEFREKYEELRKKYEELIKKRQDV